MKRALAFAAAGSLAVGIPAAAQAGTARPKVVGLTASVAHLTADGGRVSIRARVRAATTCTFTETRGTTVVASKTVPCSTGRATVTLVSAPNRTPSQVTIHFGLRAASTAGSDRARVDVVQDAMPALAVVAPGPLSAATIGLPYLTTLLSVGGVGPYTWTLVSGSLPSGLALAPDGTISGTPTSAAQATFTAQVADATGATATADFTLSVTPAPTTVERSSNWSGYVERGGPFTSVTGTFNVPSLTLGGGSEASEWVGIDGDSNQDLIQAGVAQSTSTFTGRRQVYAWWEILPAPETRISMTVSPGDQVTVTITQVATGSWTIKLVDGTSGQSFQLTTPYSGAATSAEWIVEAPTSGSGRQTSLGIFSPNVTFTRLAATGTRTETAGVEMVQGGTVVAVPSALSANGFTVAYGAAAPAAP